MTLSAIILAIKAITPARWGWIAFAIALVLMMATCTYIGIKADVERDQIVQEMNRDRAIREKQAQDRAVQQEQLRRNKEKLNEVVSQIPDSVPSASRLALACQRLRNDGHIALPPECGPAAPAEAQARP